MTTSVRLENEQLGSAHFDAIRQQDEARALEDVRAKERELEQEALHAFDDLLDHSASTDTIETSSYYKPPTSHYEDVCAGNLRDEMYSQCERELHDVRTQNARLEAQLDSLRKDFDLVAQAKADLEGKLREAQTRVSLLEQENGELSDSQTVHRVKDRYEAIIEKLKNNFATERAEIVQQLNKFREEVQQSRNHICATQEVREEKSELEQELKSLKATLEEHRQRELELRLKLKEQSIILRENERSQSPWGSCAEVLGKICLLARVSVDDIHNRELYPSLLRSCYDRFGEDALELERCRQKLDELRIVTSNLEKENHQLKEKLEQQNSSDTESQGDAIRLGSLKAAQVARLATEQLEGDNLQLKLQAQTLEERVLQLQMEVKNLVNLGSKNQAHITELLNERRQLALECQKAREAATAARRAEEMARELLEKEKLSAREEANTKLQEEVRRMELQFVQEKQAAGDAITRKLRAECVQQLCERWSLMERKREEELRQAIDLERKSCQAKADELHERAVVLAEEVEELRRENQAACQEKQEALQKLQKAETDLEEAQYQLTHKDDLTARLNSQIEDLRLKDEAQIGEVIELQRKISLLHNALKKTKGCLATAEDEREAALNSNRLLENENQCIRSKLESVSQTLSVAQQRCKQLESLGQAAESIPGTDGVVGSPVKNVPYAALKAELDTTRQKLDDAEKEINRLRLLLSEKMAAMQRVRDQLVLIKEQGNRYAAERRFLLETIDRLEGDIQTRGKKENELRRVLASLMDNVIERLSARYQL